MSNQQYSQDMHAYQMWDKVKRYFAASSKQHPKAAVVTKELALADTTVGEYLTTRHALWLDLRSTNDDQLYSSGKYVKNTSRMTHSDY